MKRSSLLLLLVMLATAVGLAQRTRHYGTPQRSIEGAALLINTSYGGHLPAADLAERFKGNFLAGLGVDYYTEKNWIIGVKGDLLFGTKVKTDVLSTLRGGEGAVYGNDGGLSNVQLRERGLLFSAHLGKVFALSGNNTRSGIRVTVGGGFLQHKIRIQDDPQVSISALSKQYKKGYDRMANGFALTEFIGYQYLAKNRLINITLGVEFIQGFTQGRRSFNFDTREPGLEKRLDLLNGYRLTWTLPLFIGENPDEINY